MSSFAFGSHEAIDAGASLSSLVLSGGLARVPKGLKRSLGSSVRGPSASVRDGHFSMSDGCTLSNVLAHERRQRLAFLPPSGKIPFIRKCAALRRLHLLQPAIAAIEPLAGAVCHFQKGKPEPIRAQLGVLRDEVLLTHPHVCRDGRDFILAHAHNARPAAAIGAALAGILDLVVLRHRMRLWQGCSGVESQRRRKLFMQVRM